MSYDPTKPSMRSGSYAESSAIDRGLQSYMQSVYHTMGLGLTLTGLTAFAVANVPALFHFFVMGPLSFIFMLAPLGFIFFGFTPQRVATMQIDKLTFLFSLFSVLMGISLSVVFVAYTGESIARTFFITAATFAGTSLYGYTTKRDLTGAGSFLFMGLWGIIIAGLVNMFMHSPGVQFVISIVSVLVFTGLTAWETQTLKFMYREGASDSNARAALMGALSMYMNFINLFMTILRFTGDRR